MTPKPRPYKPQATTQPMPPAPTTNRQLSFVVLDEYRRTSAFVSQLLDARFAAAQLQTQRQSRGPIQRQPEPTDAEHLLGSSTNRRFATELVNGVVRRQATLNALIEPHVKRPRGNVEGELWTLLQIGAYQLLFMDSVPPHAAVHETVELTKWLRRPKSSGFVNGVLRSIERNVTDELIDAPAANAVPLTAGQYRKLKQPVFPDPAADPSGYLAKAFSMPQWLIDRWQQRFDFNELTRLGFWFNAPARICLRVNNFKTDAVTLSSALSEAGIEFHPGMQAAAIWLDSSARITELPGFEPGWFSVQDESAMQAATLLDPQPGETVLDLCAAPGTKTTHMAELMNNQGRIIACDVHTERLGLVDANCQRLGITIVETHPLRSESPGSQSPNSQSPESDSTEPPSGPFDAILVDVPCSNTGVLAKRPEARWRISSKDLEELPTLQIQLLTKAVERLAANGRVVYSTCSIEPEENAAVVQAILSQNPHLELVRETHHVPGQPSDGGYQALLRRIESSGERQIGISP